MSEWYHDNPNYWTVSGHWQTKYDQLQEQVPHVGESQYRSIEVFRCAARVYYDAYNNGWGNQDNPYQRDMWAKVRDQRHALVATEEITYEEFKSLNLARPRCRFREEHQPLLEKAMNAVVVLCHKIAFGEISR